jgi:hypothetical protein
MRALLLATLYGAPGLAWGILAQLSQGTLEDNNFELIEKYSILRRRSMWVLTGACYQWYLGKP